ncbi:hypothetical protein DsansV1_C05g0052151 [Dioscorea sansibarensis]
MEEHFKSIVNASHPKVKLLASMAVIADFIMKLPNANVVEKLPKYKVVGGTCLHTKKEVSPCTLSNPNLMQLQGI